MPLPAYSDRNLLCILDWIRRCSSPTSPYRCAETLQISEFFCVRAFQILAKHGEIGVVEHGLYAANPASPTEIPPGGFSHWRLPKALKLTKRQRRLAYEVLEHLYALTDPDDPKCGVAPEAKKAVQLYVDTWITPYFEDLLDNRHGIYRDR